MLKAELEYQEYLKTVEKIGTKNGQGHFIVHIMKDGRCRTGIYSMNPYNDFKSVREAYDYHKRHHDLCSDHAHWNVCYFLEDYL